MSQIIVPKHFLLGALALGHAHLENVLDPTPTPRKTTPHDMTTLDIVVAQH